MIRSFADRLLRTPWGFPLVVVIGLAGLVGNEISYRDSSRRLEEDMRVSDVRVHAKRALYYAADLVNVLRAQLLDPSERWPERYREAGAELAPSRAIVLAFVRSAGGSGQAEADRIEGLFDRRRTDLDLAMSHAEAGRRDEALAVLRASDAAGRGAQLRSALLATMKVAEAAQLSSSQRLVTAQNASRWLVSGLIAAMLVGAYALLRQTQLVDATRRRQAEWLEGEVAARTRRLRELAGHLITTLEDERARLARELHDELGGVLSTIKLDLARLRRAPDLPAPALERARAIDQRVSEVVVLTRRVIENLRPSALDHLGLTQALSLLCRDNAAAMQVPTHEDLEPMELAVDVELALYRIAQEALTNARKYSRARQLRVSLKAQGDEVRLCVEDDGVGFAADTIGTGHHGLAGMRLRVESHGGRLSVEPRDDGSGTRVVATLPRKARAAASAPTEPPPTQD